MRVHLRGGLLALARATLEQMAGDGSLDRDAMVDLAEVRWRSADLEGAADAARAHQALGGEEPMAALILAEELTRVGQEDEARTQAGSVFDRVGDAIDVLFAGEPRGPAWPPADDGWMTADAAAPGHWGLLVGGSEVADPSSVDWANVAVSSTEAPAAMTTAIAAPAGRGGLATPGGVGSTSAAVISGRLAGAELEAVDDSLQRGDVEGASQRLAVLLRLDPALAPVILSAADRAVAVAPAGSTAASAVHVVRGDAYRTLGRDNEAAAAYQLAHQALSGGPTEEEPT